MRRKTKMTDIKMIPISDIHILNPRTRNKRIFEEITDNIMKVGLKRPITVILSKKTSDKPFTLVCGQGRLEAFTSCGQTKIPAITIEANEEKFDRFSVDCCVEINDVKEFKKRLENATEHLNLRTTKVFESKITRERKEIEFGFSYKTKFIADDVRYLDEDIIVNALELSADKIIQDKFFHKRKSIYSWQNEHRLLIMPEKNIEITYPEVHKSFITYLDNTNSLNYWNLLPGAINVHIDSIEDISEICNV